MTFGEFFGKHYVIVLTRPNIQGHRSKRPTLQTNLATTPGSDTFGLCINHNPWDVPMPSLGSRKIGLCALRSIIAEWDA